MSRASPPSLLRLAAADSVDLEVISAATQDALVKVGDLAFDPKGRRFALRLARYRWEGDRRGAGERVQSLLMFESVLAVRSHRLRLDDPEAVASLLALRFAPDAEPPGGVVKLLLAGGGEIQAVVETLDATLTDVSPPWRATRRPEHGDL